MSAKIINGLVFLLDKFDEENDGITIMRGDVLSAIESIEI